MACNIRYVISNTHSLSLSLYLSFSLPLSLLLILAVSFSLSLILSLSLSLFLLLFLFLFLFPPFSFCLYNFTLCCSLRVLSLCHDVYLYVFSFSSPFPCPPLFLSFSSFFSSCLLFLFLHLCLFLSSFILCLIIYRIYLSVSLSLSVCPFFSLCLFLCFSPALFLTLCHSLFLPCSLSLFLTFMSFSLYLFLCFCLSLSLSLSLSLALPFFAQPTKVNHGVARRKSVFKCGTRILEKRLSEGPLQKCGVSRLRSCIQGASQQLGLALQQPLPCKRYELPMKKEPPNPKANTWDWTPDCFPIWSTSHGSRVLQQIGL